MHDRTHRLLMSKMLFIFNKLTIPICNSNSFSEFIFFFFLEVILVTSQFFQGRLKSLVEILLMKSETVVLW